MRRMLTVMVVMAATTMLVAAGPEDGVKEAGAGLAAGRHQAGQGAAREISRRRPGVHARRRTDETKAQYIANVTQGPSHYMAMEPSETRVRIYGKTAVLWGLVDVTPGKGETYRTRTLEVYTQNASGSVADVAERIGEGAGEIESTELVDWKIGRLED